MRIQVGPFQELFEQGPLAGLSEATLLERFVSRRDESAFEALMRRHGPMVMGVCRGRLGDRHDAEDAFQAVFLVLARRAGSIQNPDRLAAWLFGVAARVAKKARVQAFKRHSRVRSTEAPDESFAAAGPDASIGLEARELGRLIQDELERLSGADRSAAVLCLCEGLTHEEAADRLRIPLGTLKGRVARAKEKLRRGLSKRGVTITTAALAATLTRECGARTAELPLERTLRAALAQNPQRAVELGLISSEVLILVKGALMSMIPYKLLSAGALVLTAAVTAALAMGGGSQESGEVSGRITKAESKPAPRRAASQELPAEGVMGRTRGMAGDKLFQLVEGAAIPPFVTSESATGTDLEELGKAIRRTRLLRTLEGLDSGETSQKARRILDQPLDFAFPTETPLVEVLNYVKAATADSQGAPGGGLQFHIDRQALEENETDANAPVMIDLVKIPIRLGLKLVLDQHELTYFVRDGIVIVTSKHAIDHSICEAILEKTSDK